MIKRIRFKSGFAKQYRKLDPQTKAAVDDALKDLLKHPIPAGRRNHSLAGYRNPSIYKIDVFANRSWQISYEIDGETAVLRRVAMHKQLDRLP